MLQIYAILILLIYFSAMQQPTVQGTKVTPPTVAPPTKNTTPTAQHTTGLPPKMTLQTPAGLQSSFTRPVSPRCTASPVPSNLMPPPTSPRAASPISKYYKQYFSPGNRFS